MSVSKILSSIVSGFRSEVKTDALNKMPNLLFEKADYYAGNTNDVPKAVANPYGFETAYENLKDVKVTKDLLYNHPQLVVNGSVPKGATCVYPDEDV